LKRWAERQSLGVYSNTLYEQVKDISPKENIDDFVIEQEAEIVKESAESNDESNALAEAF